MGLEGGEIHGGTNVSVISGVPQGSVLVLGIGQHFIADHCFCKTD